MGNQNFSFYTLPVLGSHTQTYNLYFREARGERGIFHLVPQLSSPERERNFLRLVAELLVCRCLPSEYSKCTPLRTLLKELLACKGSVFTVSFVIVKIQPTKIYSSSLLVLGVTCLDLHNEKSLM